MQLTGNRQRVSAINDLSQNLTDGVEHSATVGPNREQGPPRSTRRKDKTLDARIEVRRNGDGKLLRQL